MVEVAGSKKKRTIRISDRLNHDTVMEVAQSLNEACTASSAIELDLDAVTGIDLAGYQLLLSLVKTAGSNGIALTVHPGSCRARLEKLGDFAGLSQPFAGVKGWN